jgi:hypothetical protein
MPDRSRKKRPAKRKSADEDENVIARQIVDDATEEDEPDEPPNEEPTKEERRAAARMLGRRGGLKGGPARAKKLSEKERIEIARNAARTRWAIPRKKAD